MGTLGGKIGFLAATIGSFAASVPMVRLLAGPCFFEGGCGQSESLSLVLAVLASLAIGCLVGLGIRSAVNRIASLKH